MLTRAAEDGARPVDVARPSGARRVLVRDHPLRHARRYDDGEGRLRLEVPIMDFSTHLKVVCGHVRQGGLERHPRVVLELLRMLGAVADVVPTRVRADAVRREVLTVIGDARRTIAAPSDLDEALVLGQQVLERLDHSLDETRDRPAVVHSAPT